MQLKMVGRNVLILICLIGICSSSAIPISNVWNNPWLGEVLEPLPSINDNLGFEKEMKTWQEKKELPSNTPKFAFDNNQATQQLVLDLESQIDENEGQISLPLFRV